MKEYRINLNLRNSGKNTEDLYVPVDSITTHVYANNWYDAKQQILNRFSDAYNITPSQMNDTLFCSVNYLSTQPN